VRTAVVRKIFFIISFIKRQDVKQSLLGNI
jgi:hypothetical protein